MSYKTSSTTVIDSDNSVVFKEMIVGVHHTIVTALGNGASNGYAIGGYNHPPYTGFSRVEKFPFATATTDATNVGDLLTAARFGQGASRSFTHCYVAGGGNPTSSYHDNIEKFPSSADASASDVGDLTQARQTAGNTDLTGGQGYASGGNTAPTNFNTVDNYPFASDANASDVGDLTQARGYVAGQSSTTHGYVSGGYTSSSQNIIDKFPFSTDENASDVGDLTQARYSVDGTSSSTHGYTEGGYIYPGNSYPNILDKFSFASDGNATDVGDMTIQKSARAGISSMTHGYHAGGSPQVDTIDRYPFAVDENATDVGNLSAVNVNQAGNEG